MYCLNKHCAKSFCKKSFDRALWPRWRAHFYYSLHFTCCSCSEWHAYAWWRPTPPLVNAYAISLLCTELRCTPNICESCLYLFKMDWGVNIGRKLKTLVESNWAIFWSIFWIEAGLVPLLRCTQQQLFTRMRWFFFFFLAVMASGLWWTGNWNSGFSKGFLPARCFGGGWEEGPDLYTGLLGKYFGHYRTECCLQRSQQNLKSQALLELDFVFCKSLYGF